MACHMLFSFKTLINLNYIEQGFPLPLTTGGHLDPLTSQIKGHLNFWGVI